MFKKGFTHTCVSLLVFVLAGCSPSIFSDKLNDLEPLKGDGNFNKKCFGMDLSSELLSVSTMRSLITCLNSNGSIQEYEDLVKSLSDDQLKSLVDITNEHLISNHERVRDLDRSIEQLDSLGVLDRAMTRSADLMENSKLVLSALKLFHEAATDSSNNEPKLDPDLISLIEVLSRDLSAADSKNIQKFSSEKTIYNLNRFFEMGINTSKLKSYQEIVQGLNSSKPFLNSDHDLKFLTKVSLDYLKNKFSSNQTLGRLILWGIQDGSILKALDYYNYDFCENTNTGACVGGAKPLGLDHQVSSLENLMQTLNYTERETVLKNLVTLFSVLDAPLSCMGGSKEIPNADLFVMDEMAKRSPLDVPLWVTRDNAIKLALSNSLCNLPSGPAGETFNALVGVLRKLSVAPLVVSDETEVQGRSMVTMASLVRVFDIAGQYPLSDEAKEDLADFLKSTPESLRFRRFMISWMGDPSPFNLYSHLSYLLAEVGNKERNILGNVMYLLNYPAPGSEDRSDIQSVIHSLLKHRANYKNGKSSYDVLSRSFQRISSQSLFELFLGISEFIDKPENYVGPLSVETRNALLANSAHPLVDFTFEITNDTVKHKKFFETLYEISYKPELVNAIRLTGKMSRNGSLKEFLKGLLVMFRGTTNKLPGGPELVVVPEVKPILADRDKSVSGRKPWNPVNSNWPADPDKRLACDDLNLDWRFSNTRSREWEQQMRRMASCVNATQKNGDIETFLNYALTEKVRANQSVLGFAVEWLSNVIPDSSPEIARKIYDEFSDLLTDNSKFQDMLFMNKLMAFLFENKYCSKYSDEPGFQCPQDKEEVSIMQALFRATYFAKARELSLTKIFGFGKTLIQHSNLHSVAKYIYDLSQEAEKTKNQFSADPKPKMDSYPIDANPPNNLLRARLDAGILLHESRNPTEAIRNEKIQEYFKQSLPGINQRYTDEHGKSRIGFKSSKEFKHYVYPLFKHLAQGSTLEWFMTFFYYFDHSPYTPEWWADWIKRLSSSINVLPYYYPGQIVGKDKPTVRLISDLEILELMVVDGDFSLRDIGMEGTGGLFKDVDENTSIKYLTLLASSGDDLTPVLDQMKEEMDFFGDIMDRSPFLLNDEAKRRLSNMRVEYPLFKKVNRMHEFVGSDGVKIKVNNLWVLRDLFKAVLSATPPHLRNKYYRDTNTLHLIGDLVRIGFLKVYTQAMWYKDSNGKTKQTDIVPILETMYRSSIVIKDGKRSLNPNAVRILSYLVREDCQKLTPNLVCSQFPDPLNQLFDYRFRTIGKAIDYFFEWTKNDHEREDKMEPRNTDVMKRIGYDLFAMINDMDQGNDSDHSLTAKFVESSVPFMATDQGTSFLREQLELLKNLITDREWAQLTDLFLESEKSQPENFSKFKNIFSLALNEMAKNQADISAASLDVLDAMYQDPKKSFSGAIDATRWMTEDPRYLDLKPEFKRITKNVMEWVAKDSENHQLRPRLQHQIGESLTNGDFLDLTRFIGNQSGGNNSDKLYNEIKFLGSDDTLKRMNSFLEEMRAGLVDIFNPQRRIFHIP